MNLNSVREIADAIRHGHLSAERVMRQALEAASDAHQQTNCVVQFMDTIAIKEAKDLDQRINNGQQFNIQRYPLLGVPISVKDMLHVKGADTVAGASERVGKPQPQDSAIIALIRNAGGIPFCKTNVPQFVWTAESDNPVIGATCNPVNPHATCGGSSGGEGALIAGGGSILGVGSDVGGSLRIPAHFCGIYAFKPTHGRLPTRGHMEYFGGQESIPAVVGPMANSVDNLTVFMEACLNQEPWKSDWNLNPIPFNSTPLPTKLRIGYYTSDGNFPASPPCHRAVMTSIKLLQEAGHDCIPFHPPRVPFALNTFMQIANADGMASCKKWMSKKDPLDDHCKNYMRLLKLPKKLKLLLIWWFENMKQPNSADLIRTFQPKSVKRVWQLTEMMRDYQREFQLAWQSNQLDFVICPTSGLPAHPHKMNPIVTPSFGYTMLYNFLDYPSGALPVTTVDPNLDGIWLDPPTQCRLQRPAVELYDPIKMSGLPVGVQIIAPRNRDESVLSLMTQLDHLLITKSSKSF